MNSIADRDATAPLVKHTRRAWGGPAFQPTP